MKYAILGTNWLCENYREAIAGAGDTLTAVVSREKARAAAFAPQAAAYDDLDEMLRSADVDGVYVCLPNTLHRDAAIRCLRAGKHVLCEKPMALRHSDAEQMFEEAHKAGKILAEGVMSAYSPLMPRLKEEIRADGVVSARLDYSQYSSKIDRVRRGEMFSSFDRRLGGGAMYDLGVYPLHFAAALFGAPESLTAGARWLGDVDVSDVMILHYGNFDVTVTASKAGQSRIGSEILLNGSTLTFENVSVILGAKKITKAGTEILDTGDAVIPRAGTNPSSNSALQERVIRRFSAWMRGEDGETLKNLEAQTKAVAAMLEEGHRQIGYTV